MKTKKILKMLLEIFLAITCVTAPSVVFCLPQVAEVERGSADISYPDANTMRITATDRSIINYSSFDVNQDEAVIITLPSADSRSLNRAFGPEASRILGDVKCNGVFVLINSSGIYVGRGANIEAVNAILSTRDITGSNFINGEYIFKRISQDQLDRLLVNEGRITVRRGGFGVLMAGAIENRGAIVAKAGRIALASGDAVAIELAGNCLIAVAIDEPSAKGVMDYEGNPVTDQVRSTGMLDAEGGSVILKAEQINEVFRRGINLEGVVQGTRVVKSGGTVRIVADSEVAGYAIAPAAPEGDIIIKSPVVNIVNIDENISIEEETKGEIRLAVSEELVSGPVEAEEPVRQEPAFETTSPVIKTERDAGAGCAALIPAQGFDPISFRNAGTASFVLPDKELIIRENIDIGLPMMRSSGIGTSLTARGPPLPEFAKLTFSEKTSNKKFDLRVIENGNPYTARGIFCF